MESIWKPNTNYYVELNQGQAKKVLGDDILSRKNYNPKHDGSVRLLDDVWRTVKYLQGNKIAFDINMIDAVYNERVMKDGSIINVRGVQDYISESDFNFAFEFFEVDEFLTQEEYDNLIPIEESLIK